MNGFMGSVVSIVGLFTGVAIVAALVSKNANTANVIGAGFGGIATDLTAGLAPITGGGGLGSMPSING